MTLTNNFKVYSTLYDNINNSFLSKNCSLTNKIPSFSESRNELCETLRKQFQQVFNNWYACSITSTDACSITGAPSKKLSDYSYPTAYCLNIDIVLGRSYLTVVNNGHLVLDLKYFSYRTSFVSLFLIYIGIQVQLVADNPGPLEF